MDEEIKIEGNIDINQALKEFEVKSSTEQIQKSPEVLKISKVPKMVELVMKWFGFEEQKQAEYVLLGFVVITIVISIYLFFGTNSSNDAGLKQKKLYPPGSSALQ